MFCSAATKDVHSLRKSDPVCYDTLRAQSLVKLSLGPEAFLIMFFTFIYTLGMLYRGLALSGHGVRSARNVNTVIRLLPEALHRK